MYMHPNIRDLISTGSTTDLISLIKDLFVFVDIPVVVWALYLYFCDYYTLFFSFNSTSSPV